MKRKVGRPTDMTEAVLAKLEHAFSLACTDNEACLYANISPSVLYRYQERNPEYQERKDELKQNPVLKAKTTVVNELDDIKNAQWYLERRSPEFKPKSETDLTTKGERVQMTPELAALAKEYEEKLKKTL